MRKNQKGAGRARLLRADRNLQRLPSAMPLNVVIASGMYMPFTVGQLCRLIASSSFDASNNRSPPHSYARRRRTHDKGGGHGPHGGRKAQVVRAPSLRQHTV